MVDVDVYRRVGVCVERYFVFCPDAVYFKICYLLVTRWTCILAYFERGNTALRLRPKFQCVVGMDAEFWQREVVVGACVAVETA